MLRYKLLVYKTPSTSLYPSSTSRAIFSLAYLFRDSRLNFTRLLAFFFLYPLLLWNTFYLYIFPILSNLQFYRTKFAFLLLQFTRRLLNSTANIRKITFCPTCNGLFRHRTLAPVALQSNNNTNSYSCKIRESLYYTTLYKHEK